MTKSTPPTDAPACEFIPKAWGGEHIYASNSMYCGKVLEFNHAGAEMSMHFHLAKHESWYVLDGRFGVHWIDPHTATLNMMILERGDTWVNAPGDVHRLHCHKPGRILEVSTADSSADNYRVAPGDSQRSEPVPDPVTEPIADTSALEIPDFLYRKQSPYALKCSKCDHVWHAKEPMCGWANMRCPHCSTPVTAEVWDAKHRLPFRPTA